MELINSDIIIWEGVICEWGAVKHIALIEDVKLANEDEIKQRKYTI